MISRRGSVLNVAAVLNGRPRKTLGWRRPADLFVTELAVGAVSTPLHSDALISGVDLIADGLLQPIEGLVIVVVTLKLLELRDELPEQAELARAVGDIHVLGRFAISNSQERMSERELRMTRDDSLRTLEHLRPIISARVTDHIACLEYGRQSGIVGQRWVRAPRKNGHAHHVGNACGNFHRQVRRFPAVSLEVHRP